MWAPQGWALRGRPPPMGGGRGMGPRLVDPRLLVGSRGLGPRLVGLSGLEQGPSAVGPWVSVQRGGFHLDGPRGDGRQGWVQRVGSRRLGLWGVGPRERGSGVGPRELASGGFAGGES